MGIVSEGGLEPESALRLQTTVSRRTLAYDGIFPYRPIEEG